MLLRRALRSSLVDSIFRVQDSRNLARETSDEVRSAKG